MRRELEQLQVRYEDLAGEHQRVLDQLHRYEQPSECSEAAEDTSMWGFIYYLFCSFLFLFTLFLSFFTPVSYWFSSLPPSPFSPLPLTLPSFLHCTE